MQYKPKLILLTIYYIIRLPALFIQAYWMSTNFFAWGADKISNQDIGQVWLISFILIGIHLFALKKISQYKINPPASP